MLSVVEDKIKGFIEWAKGWGVDLTYWAESKMPGMSRRLTSTTSPQGQRTDEFRTTLDCHISKKVDTFPGTCS